MVYLKVLPNICLDGLIKKNEMPFTAVYIDKDSNRVPSQEKPQTVLLELTCLACGYVLGLNIYTLNIAH